MSRLRWVWTLSLLLWPTTGLGQSVAGTVLDEETGGPIPGTFVVLTDSAGTEVARALTTGSGTFRIAPPAAGTFRLRVERIGIADVTTEAFPIADGEVVSRIMTVSRAPIRLADMEVESTPQCTMLEEDATALIRVWDEARKALEATVWTGMQAYYRFDGLLSKRNLDTDGKPVGRVELEPIRSYGARPFAVPANPNDLVFGGWVQRVRGNNVAFYAPDARILLSEGFTGRHCYRLEPGEVEGEALLGIHFEPLPTRRLTDISGVLWVEPETAELRKLEFRYEGLDVPFDTSMIGGEVEFDRLPDGAWIVRRFTIRTPRLRSARSTRLIGLYEEGKSVTAIWRTGDLQAGPTGQVPEGVAPVNAPADELIIRYPSDF
jgi:hypothetical protein